MENDLDRIMKMRDRLNAVSPSFCLAKWLQVTIHLQTGQTHSCHHPAPHSVDVAALEKNPSALHNTSDKKLFRKGMLVGKRPAECDYCWKIEDAPGQQMSDRHFKSCDSWAEPDFERVRSMPWDANVNPTYVEVSFSNLCNFKCAYCQPKDSSKWMEEIRTHGHYPTGNRLHNLEEIVAAGAMPIPESKPNVFVDAFWKWWPELYPSLKVFRITGGEPLLHKSTYRVLDHVMSNPKPDLELSINSNLGVPDKLIDQFIFRIKDIRQGGRIKDLTVFTSLDTWGKQAEYIRHGLSLEVFQKNVERLLAEVPGIKITIMCTFNALSVPGFQGLLEYVISLREKYSTGVEGSSWIFLDISYLRNPSCQSAQLLPPELWPSVENGLRYMEENSIEKVGAKTGFHAFEVAKMRRLLAWMKEPVNAERLVWDRRDFLNFFEEHDRRRGTDFLATFPELTEFWKICRNAKDSFDRPKVANECTDSSIQLQT